MSSLIFVIFPGRHSQARDLLNSTGETLDESSLPDLELRYANLSQEAEYEV